VQCSADIFHGVLDAPTASTPHSEKLFMMAARFNGTRIALPAFLKNLATL
jgi:hypothetical protein